MNDQRLKEFWLAEEKKSFQGWDFSYINNRISEEPLPWDYDQIVRHYLKEESLLLDMGTGGGEYLLSLNHPYHNTYATEAYPPNVELCKKKLSPLGIDVRQVEEDDLLPFDDASFDIVINRHESFDISEVKRVIKPKGIFITQQVGGLNNKELAHFLLQDFTEITPREFTLDYCLQQIRKNGLSVLQSAEYFPKTKFLDIGALVYFAKVIEWEFPNFSVDRCFSQLCQLQAQVEQQGFVEACEHRFLIVAQKP